MKLAGTRLTDDLRDHGLSPKEKGRTSEIAANMKPLYEKEARERQKLTQLVGDRTQAKDLLVGIRGDAPVDKARTSEIVGKMFGVSRGTVDRASAVIKNGVEELQEAVKLKPLYVEEAKLRQTQLAGTRKNNESDPTCCGMEGMVKGEVNKIVGDMLGISKAGKSTFQWIGGYKKYTYFVYR